MDHQRLGEIVQRNDARTPGKWVIGKGAYSHLIDSDGDPHRGLIAEVDNEDCDVHGQAQANREFIAHAPEDITDLLEALHDAESRLLRAGTIVCGVVADDDLTAVYQRALKRCEHLFMMLTPLKNDLDTLQKYGQQTRVSILANSAITKVLEHLQIIAADKKCTTCGVYYEPNQRDCNNLEGCTEPHS